MLGVFLLLTFTYVEHECQDHLSPCEGIHEYMCAQIRPRLILSSEREEMPAKLGSKEVNTSISVRLTCLEFSTSISRQIALCLLLRKTLLLCY